MAAGFQHATHDHDGDVAVFLIGLRINQIWRPDLWMPALQAMGPMMRELHAAKAAALAGEGEHPGFLGHRSLLGAGGPTIVQYWRSVDDIYAYAHDADRAHRPAWKAFYERGRKAAGAVGVWHETYAVPAGAHESLYISMAPIGLAVATGASTDRTRRRHARLSERGAASEPRAEAG